MVVHPTRFDLGRTLAQQQVLGKTVRSNPPYVNTLTSLFEVFIFADGKYRKINMNDVVKVVCRDGEVGILKEVIVNPKTEQPTNLIVSRTACPTKTVRVHVLSTREVNEH